MKNKKLIILLLLITVIAVDGCRKKEVADSDEPFVLEYGNLPTPTIPSDNPLTREGVKLGRMLFYEKMLSADNTMSCASCHDQKNAFTDTARFSVGIRQMEGKRQAMAVFNMLWNTNEFFWDGRAHLLRHQSLKPIQDELEMDETLENAVAKLQASEMYREQFRKAFGTETVDTLLMSKAMEQFMNSIVSYQSKYDDYLAGRATLTAEEERGRFLFFTEYNPAFPNATGADCQHCHGGDNFENDSYMNNGLDDDANFTDIGREDVTGEASDRAKFKVPSLRNVELTAPYMHDGRFKTLEEVVDHYNLVTSSSTMDASFQQQLPDGLLLSDEDKAALVAFLKTLTDRKFIENPDFSDPF